SNRGIRPAMAHSSATVAPSGRSLAGSATQSASLSFKAIGMLAWLAGVLLLLGKLARSQWRFRMRLKQGICLDMSRLPIDLRDLSARAGYRQLIRLVEHAGMAVPAVWGIMRPTIIMPRGVISSLPTPQLRWLLLHELAHVGRRDLVVVAVQRAVAILHFFNP